MIIQFTMKTPDIIDRIMDDLPEPKTEKQEIEYENIRIRLEAWFSYGENLTIEYNKNNDTMKVMRSKR